MRRMAADGRTVLISSHLMGELEGTADHLIVVGRGRLVADTSVAELLARASGDRVEVRTTHRPEAMALLARAGATVAAVDHETLTVTGLGGERVAALMTEAGLPFAELRRHRATLEAAYMDLTRDSVQFGVPSVEGAR